MISLYSPFTVVDLKNMKQRARRNNTVKKTITINFGYFIFKRCGYNLIIHIWRHVGDAPTAWVLRVLRRDW